MSKKKAPTKKDKEKKYNWVLTSDNKVACFKSSRSMQTVNGLWELNAPTEFHDAKLAKATIEINTILDRVAASNKDPSRGLGFILIGSSPLLVWAEYGAVGSDDDTETIASAVGLKEY